MTALIHIMGTALIWLLALALFFSYPTTELARGFASNPDQHPRSRGAMVMTALGLVLISVLIWGPA